METITTAATEESHQGTAQTCATGSGSGGQMTVGKHVCPEEYLNSFTPMEFEEVGGHVLWCGQARGYHALL